MLIALKLRNWLVVIGVRQVTSGTPGVTSEFARLRNPPGWPNLFMRSRRWAPGWLFSRRSQATGGL